MSACIIETSGDGAQQSYSAAARARASRWSLLGSRRLGKSSQAALTISHLSVSPSHHNHRLRWSQFPNTIRLVNPNTMPREFVGVVIFRRRTRPAAPVPAAPAPAPVFAVPFQASNATQPASISSVAKRPSTGSTSSPKPTKEPRIEVI